MPGHRCSGPAHSKGGLGEQAGRAAPPRPLCFAEEAVNEVKRQAMSELQKAVSDAERKAHELISTERAKMERALAEARRQASEDALTVINQQEDSSEVVTPSPTSRSRPWTPTPSPPSLMTSGSRRGGCRGRPHLAEGTLGAPRGEVACSRLRPRK